MDIARAAAISGVLMSHVLLSFTQISARQPLLWLGEASVELFFSLSGFLIGGILIDMAQTDIRLPSVGKFLFRRWMRTLPLYYLGLIVYDRVYSIHDPHSYFFLQNFHTNEPRSMVVSWSLVLEEYFYFTFPLLLFLQRFFTKGVRAVAWVAVGLIFICTVVRLLDTYSGYGHEFVPIPDLYQNPLLRLDCCAYGVLAVCLLRGRPSFTTWLAGQRWPLALALLLVFCWGMLFHAVSGASVPELIAWRVGYWGPAYFAVQHAALDLLFAVVVAELSLIHIPLPAWTRWGIVQISLVSYSIYIFHALILNVVSGYLVSLPAIEKVTLLLVATLAFSVASYYGIERSLLKLRDRVAPARSSHEAKTMTDSGKGIVIAGG